MNAPRYTVTTDQAHLCVSFLLDNDDEGSLFGEVPSDLHKAAHEYQAGVATGLEAAREAIERWLLVDRDACVALLGPGLGIDEEEQMFAERRSSAKEQDAILAARKSLADVQAERDALRDALEDLLVAVNTLRSKDASLALPFGLTGPYMRGRDLLRGSL